MTKETLAMAKVVYDVLGYTKTIGTYGVKMITYPFKNKEENEPIVMQEIK